MKRTVVNLVVVGVGLFNLILGMWAFVAPRSFFDTVATFPPFNQHLLHDVGAFQAALGATLLIAVCVRDGLSVAILGNLVAATIHVVSHVIDADLGGRPTDPVGLAFVAGALVLALLLYRQRHEATSIRDASS